MINWSKEIIDFLKGYHEVNHKWLDEFAEYPSGHLGLVNKENGFLELYDGNLRALDANGKIILNDVSNNDYIHHFNEGVEKWSYLKFPYLKDLGKEKGLRGTIVSVGPGYYCATGEFVPTTLKEGQQVILPAVGPSKVELDGQEYWSCGENVVLAIIND